MLRPYDPNNTGLMTLDRIVSDSGTGVLYLATFAVVYLLFLLLHAATAIPRFALHALALLAHGGRSAVPPAHRPSH